MNDDPNATRAADTPPPACSTCRYFDSKAEECRKNAPTRITSGSGGMIWPAFFGFLMGGTSSGFPSVEATDWCGEHNPSNIPDETRASRSLQPMVGNPDCDRRVCKKCGAETKKTFCHLCGASVLYSVSFNSDGKHESDANNAVTGSEARP